jgi:hypothetical protein
MKLFWTIFGAILAAAAVIWGVWSFVALRERDAATDLSMMERLAAAAKTADDLATVDRRIPSVSLDDARDRVLIFEQILRRGRVDPTKARSLATALVFDYREVVTVVRGEMPERREWADEMEALLSRVEAAAQSL